MKYWERSSFSTVAGHHARRHDEATLRRDVSDPPAPAFVQEDVALGQGIPVGLGLGTVKRAKVLNQFGLRHFVPGFIDGTPSSGHQAATANRRRWCIAYVARCRFCR